MNGEDRCRTQVSVCANWEASALHHFSRRSLGLLKDLEDLRTNLCWSELGEKFTRSGPIHNEFAPVLVVFSNLIGHRLDIHVGDNLSPSLYQNLLGAGCSFETNDRYG